jgi:hypothetical protein
MLAGASRYPGSASPLHAKLQGTWNWHEPERCQFLATEVSRDFIPPCPARISPAQAAALGPAIPGGCGTLAANSIPGVEQGTCQTGCRVVSAALSGMFAGQMRYSAKCMAIPEEMALSVPGPRRSKNAKYTSQYDVARPPRVAGCVRFAAFEAACTDSSRPLVVRPFNRSLLSLRAGWHWRPRSAASWRRSAFDRPC